MLLSMSVMVLSGCLGSNQEPTPTPVVIISRPEDLIQLCLLPQLRGRRRNLRRHRPRRSLPILRPRRYVVAEHDGLIDGVVTDIVLSPKFPNDDTAFLSTVRNGVFKSTNRGDLWEQDCQGSGTPQRRRDRISPDFASDRTLFAGTPVPGHLPLHQRRQLLGAGRASDQQRTRHRDIARICDRRSRYCWYGTERSFPLRRRWRVLGRNKPRSWYLRRRWGVRGSGSPRLCSRPDRLPRNQGGGPVKTTNGGNFWRPVDEGLTSLKTVGLVLSPNFRRDGLLFMATLNGNIFVSTDQAKRLRTPSSRDERSARLRSPRTSRPTARCLWAGHCPRCPERQTVERVGRTSRSRWMNDLRADERNNASRKEAVRSQHRRTSEGRRIVRGWNDGPPCRAR